MNSTGNCDGCKYNGKGYEWCETTKGIYGCFESKQKGLTKAK